MRTVGNYRLRSLVGRGATSEVYTAEHVLLGDVVALKLLRPELAEDPTQTHALVDEGTKVRAIDHPNVVRVLDAGLDGDACYLVMEFVAGETLSKRLREQGRMTEAEVRRLGAELADGVAAAHARGIVHRDLKPANVMLDGTQPKIVDFGIAKHLGARSAVTTGRMIGTLAYMAPEQLASGMIAPCTDVWALGVILFEALCGRHPFDNFSDGRCPQLFDEPARASAIVAVSPELDAILARCLTRDPAMRIASAVELAALLRGERVLDDERVTADAGPIVRTPASAPASAAATVPAPSPAPAKGRSRAWIALAIGGALAAVGIGALALRDPAPAAPASVPPATSPSAPPVIVLPTPVVTPVETEPVETKPAETKPPPKQRTKRREPTKHKRRETLD